MPVINPSSSTGDSGRRRLDGFSSGRTGHVNVAKAVLGLRRYPGHSGAGQRLAEAVSQPGSYGFVDRNTTSDGTGIPGGVGGGAGCAGHTIFYVGVPDVEAALQKAESLGGTRRMGPDRAPGTSLVVGHFTDHEANLIGVAGPM